MDTDKTLLQNLHKLLMNELVELPTRGLCHNNFEILCVI